MARNMTEERTAASQKVAEKLYLERYQSRKGRMEKLRESSGAHLQGQALGERLASQEVVDIRVEACEWSMVAMAAMAASVLTSCDCSLAETTPVVSHGCPTRG